MKLLSLFYTFLLSLSVSMVIASDEWLTDFDIARKEASKRDLPILAVFSGSDWCIWCVRLEKEILNQEAFKKFASENLVLFLADFPRSKEQPLNIKEQNEKLRIKYEIKGFPTVLLLDAEGNVLAKNGYQRGGAEPYVQLLKEYLDKIKNEKKTLPKNQNL